MHPAIMKYAPLRRCTGVLVLSCVPKRGLAHCRASAGVLWSNPEGLNCTLCGDNIDSNATDPNENPLAPPGLLVKASTSSCCKYHSCCLCPAPTVHSMPCRRQPPASAINLHQPTALQCPKITTVLGAYVCTCTRVVRQLMHITI